MAKQQRSKDEISFRINNEIPYYKEVRLIGEGFNGDIVPMKEAISLAEKAMLDLVEINTKASPPIIKMCNYSKLIYEMKKAAKKNKQSAQQLKEIQLSVNIASHDLETKAKQARRFIEGGDKVKVVLTMRGRELTRREENKRSLYEFLTMIEESCVPEALPKDEGNKTIVILKKKNK